MIDKLKKVKIQYDDGTLSAEIPIATDINHVDGLDDKLKSMQNEIGSLASGSPLVASSIAGMTDTTKVYVNTTDGNWYYYNGTSWTAGGVYQAAEDSETVNQLKEEINLVYKEYPYPEFNVTKGEPTVGSGDISTSIYRYSTTKIEIKNNETIKLIFKNLTDKVLTFNPYYFDDSGICISKGMYQEIEQNGIFELDYANVPTNAKYICISGKTKDVKDTTNYLSTIKNGIQYIYVNAENKILKDNLDNKYTDIISRISGNEERILSLENPANDIPSYFESQLNNAVNQINNNMNLIGKNGDTFSFITDIHIENNQMNSPKLIKYIKEHTNLNDIICGGDLFNYGTTKAAGIEKLNNVMNYFKFLKDDFITILGNHDNNSSQSIENRLTVNEVYNLMFKHQEKRVSEWGGVFVENNPYQQYNWYEDNIVTKTRRIFLSSATGSIGGIQLNWLRTILNKEDDYKVLIFVHYIYANHNYTSDGTQLKNICDEHTDKVMGIFTGHVHFDKVDYTTAGIPIIFTTTDSSFPLADDDGHTADGTIGTVNELGFDNITVDYSTGTIYCVRIGRGSDRIINSRVNR